MPAKFVAPSPTEPAYTCPRCETLCTQERLGLVSQGMSRTVEFVLLCVTCQKVTLWEPVAGDMVLVYPHASSAPEPNADLPDDIKAAT